MRTAFLVDDFGTYKVLLGEDVVANPAAAYAVGLTDAAVLAQIATHTLARGAKPYQEGRTAHVDTDASGAVVLTFFWSNGSVGTAVLHPAKA
jgi:hypothetical protein